MRSVVERVTQAKLVGKSDIYSFRIEIFGNIRSFDFLCVKHYEHGNVLCQVVNIIRDRESMVGECRVIGFREEGIFRNIRTPFLLDSDIALASDNQIREVVGLNRGSQSFLGLLEHHPNLRVSIDLKKTITKHIAILAKSGAGKSYTVGVLLEEILSKNIPVLILDPHNEYSSLKYPNPDLKDKKRLKQLKLKPCGFKSRIKEFSPDIKSNPQAHPIALNLLDLSVQDLISSFPQKISPSQQGLLLSILSNYDNKINFDELIFALSNDDNNSKWTLISQLEQLKKLNLYSSSHTPLNFLVKHRQCSIISLKGVEPFVCETFVTGLLKELFNLRKLGSIPPFFLVIEEAHNFCPEASLGQLKSSKVIRTLAGEGRKFGIGLCVISQRPAKLDKNVISQCTTQILLKMTNPNDLKSVIASSEGVDSSSAQEIQKLNIGTCLLTGVVDIPLKVNVRPRISKHGGETVDITMPYEEKKQEGEEKEQKPLTPPEKLDLVEFIGPEISREEAASLSSQENLLSCLVPATLFRVKIFSQECSLLIEKEHATIIKSLFPYKFVSLPKSLFNLTQTEREVLHKAREFGEEFSPAEFLLGTNMMYNEILRVCDSLCGKDLLVKKDKHYKQVLLNKNVFKTLNFKGQKKFEEVCVHKYAKERYSTEKLESLVCLFGKIISKNDVFILKYT